MITDEPSTETGIEIDDEEVNLKNDKQQNEQSDEVVKKKKKKRAGKIGKTYRSRYMCIGQIHCIFLSCYYKGKSPLLTLGPSWPFTSVLIILGILILFYFYIMLSMATKAMFLHKLWCQFCIGLNIFALFGGILKNPGIPQELIDRILKEDAGKGEDNIELQDLESGSGDTKDAVQRSATTNKGRKGPRTPIKPGNIWCRFC